MFDNIVASYLYFFLFSLFKQSDRLVLLDSIMNFESCHITF